jgi:hypothetical protein
MNSFRTMQTAGFLKSLLDLAFWAIVLLAPVYVVLVTVGYLRSGEPDMALGVDAWFNPTPSAWMLEGDGSRAARIVHGVGAVRFQRLPWPDLAALRIAEGLYVAWQFRRPGLELWPFRLDLPLTV